MSGNITVGIDTGGTFTDVMAVDADGQVYVEKVPSTPHDPGRAVMNGLKALAETHDLDQADIRTVVHGTTVALNALLQHRWSSLGLMVTEGYREILEIGRQTVPGEWGSIYTWSKPDRVVPLEHVVEVTERRGVDGETLIPLDEEQVRETARAFKQQGIQAMAIVFLHSYQYPEHEERALEIVREEYPECFLAASSTILREFREYERAVTTCLSAAMMPVVSEYLDSLSAELADSGYDVPLLIMKSSGGLSRAAEASKQPISLVYSGPSGGVLGMAWLANEIGESQVLTCDMGGTSTDVAAIENGKPLLTTEGTVDVYPIRLPIIDQVSVGAGGGSIATVGSGGRLRVGPESAGADPGPICYGKGGTEVTITDANVVLGRSGTSLIGGGMTLDADAARKGVEGIAETLGLSVDETAAGIVEIAVSNMAGAVREVSVRRGRDPREHVLFAFGGAGPLHAVQLAELLGTPKVIIPRDNGLGACLGLLSSDVQESTVHPFPQVEAEERIKVVGEICAELEAQLRDEVTRQGVSAENVRMERFADARYEGTVSELTVPARLGDWNESLHEDLVESFHDEHAKAYGYNYKGEQPVEIVNLRVTATGLTQDLNLAGSDGAAQLDAAEIDRREVYIDAEVGRITCPVYDRAALTTASAIEGPSIIESFDSTVFIPNRWSGKVDQLRNIVLERGSEGGQS